MRWGWVIGLLVLLVGCNIVGHHRHEQTQSPRQPQSQSSGLLYVMADSLNVRSTPSTSGAVLLSISRGTAIQPARQSGNWIGVELDDGSIGWVSSRYLAAAAPSEPDRGEIIDAIIQDSIDRYDGPCPCPYNRMRNGAKCGGRSAYSKPGGASPICYAEQVTDAMLAEFTKRH